MQTWLGAVRRLDTKLYAAVAATETPRLDVAMRRLSRTADHGVLWLGVAGALAAAGGRPGRDAARGGLLSLGLASASANLIAKPLTTRRRPEREELAVLVRRHVPMPRTSSFPSGHAASAFAFAVGASRGRPVLAPPLLSLAALVGYSRVHTGVHYPADVLAGAVIGAAAAGVARRLLSH